MASKNSKELQDRLLQAFQCLVDEKYKEAQEICENLIADGIQK
jgi:hypothetical protein